MRAREHGQTGQPAFGGFRLQYRAEILGSHKIIQMGKR